MLERVAILFVHPNDIICLWFMLNMLCSNTASAAHYDEGLLTIWSAGITMTSLIHKCHFLLVSAFFLKDWYRKLVIQFSPKKYRTLESWLAYLGRSYWKTSVEKYLEALEENGRGKKVCVSV